MNNVQFEQLIFKHNATTDIKRFAMLKSWAQFYNECQRADWLLWLYYKTQTTFEEQIILQNIQIEIILLLIINLEAPEVDAVFKAEIYALSKNCIERQFNFIQKYYYECTGKDERLQYINKELIDIVKKQLPIQYWAL